jgi:hypothetical protein
MIGAECNSDTATSKLQYSGCAIKKQASGSPGFF